MATYTIKAIKYCEQTVPGPQMFFMSHWDRWLEADFYFFVLRRDDGQRQAGGGGWQCLGTW